MKMKEYKISWKIMMEIFQEYEKKKKFIYLKK